MISIIIPVLNEAKNIEDLLCHISECASEKNILEIIVIDGGSVDGTKKVVLDFAEKSKYRIECISSEKGRAKQMNAGAERAKGLILYFLHADSFPPKSFDFDIISEVKKGNEAGCFRMKFDSSHPILKISQWFTRFNFKVCRGGDQSLYITKTLFNKLSGFNEKYTIYEDCEFTNRIYDRFNFKIIPKNIITSSRKYAQIGTCKLQYHFTMVHIKNRLGASPQELYNYYEKHIAT
jgi:rSAM/selenodomain-associated transferase 2